MNHDPLEPNDEPQTMVADPFRFSKRPAESSSSIGIDFNHVSSDQS